MNHGGGRAAGEPPGTAATATAATTAEVTLRIRAGYEQRRDCK
jgi:hypothetical protein